VRKKLEETFGQFELAQRPNPQIAEAEADLVATLTEGIRERRLVEIEYQKEGEQTWSKRIVEPYSLERELPNWRVHTWDRSRDAERSFRLDRMRSAQLTQDLFEPRPAFDPHGFRDGRSAKILYLKGVAARWAAERGATLLKDGTALAEMPVGSPEWLIGEVLFAARRGDPARARRDAQGRCGPCAGARERARRLAPARPRLAGVSLLDPRHCPFRLLAQQLVVALEERLHKVEGRRGRRCSREQRAHCGADSAHRSSGHTAARNAWSAPRRRPRANP